MARPLNIGIIQSAFGDSIDSNIKTVETLIRAAAKNGAQIILAPELFQGPYFCKTEDATHFAAAYPIDDHPVVKRLAPLAGELGVVLPLSVFEKAGDRHFNTMVLVDSDGSIAGRYRKSHIPSGPGYEEKYYFEPGDTGFKVWETKFGTIGVGICWDQWFPEAARAMVLMGAELLLYPTAIGSEPANPALDTQARWRRVMVGHAVANVTPVVAANRVGDEDGQVFYGSSFLCDDAGDLLIDMSRTEEGFETATVDLDAISARREDWGLHKDRRPDLYKILTEPI